MHRDTDSVINEIRAIIDTNRRTVIPPNQRRRLMRLIGDLEVHAHIDGQLSVLRAMEALCAETAHNLNGSPHDTT